LCDADAANVVLCVSGRSVSIPMQMLPSIVKQATASIASWGVARLRHLKFSRIRKSTLSTVWIRDTALTSCMHGAEIENVVDDS
jgi:hypothetical protein